ncbi:MAG: hypothetical protein U0638_10600 [Phycisphaerales bacterium]
MTNTKLGACLAAACVMVMSSLAVARQCEEQWLPGGGIAGASSTVYASARWDPDGPGPIDEVFVLGGRFAVAGDVPANGLATWDGEHWATLGSGLDLSDPTAQVRVLLPLSDGRLVVGGVFTSINGIPCQSIAVFDGASWHPLSAGLTKESQPGEVNGLAVLPSGDIIAGGVFWYAGGLPVKLIARWDGTTWHSMGAGLDYPGASGVQSLAFLGDGRLVAAGDFSKSGSTFVYGVAAWDGAVWTSLGGGVGGAVHALATLSDGSLIAGGDFTSAGGSPAIALARWNGTTWSAYAPGIPNGHPVYALAQLSDGHLLVGGNFNKINSTTFNFIGEWDGTQWVQLQGGVYGVVDASSPVRSLTVTIDDHALVAGGFTRVRGSGARNLAIWDRASWRPVGSGFDDKVRTVAAASNGEVYACGDFRQAEGVVVNMIARQTRSGWAPLGAGLDPGGSGWAWAESAEVAPNGDVFVGGNFASAGTVAASNIARWDGAEWHPLGAGVSGLVKDIAIDADGNVLAAGSFSSAGGVPATGVAHWDGAQWTPLGILSSSTTVIAVAAGGVAYAGGSFSQANGAPGNYVARWDGSQWTPLGVGLGGSTTPIVATMIVLPNGDMIVGGTFSLAGGIVVSNIARWDGTQWHSMGTGLDGRAGGLALLPDGDLLVAGAFNNAGGVPAQGLAIWDGTSWSSFHNNVATDTASSVAVGPGGDVYVGGCLTAGVHVSGWFAHFGSPCNCPADFNHDGFVNGNDYDDFAVLFDEANQAADFNGDGFVNGNDYDEFADHFDVGC